MNAARLAGAAAAATGARRDPRLVLTVFILAAALLGVFAVHVPAARGAYTAKITNATDTAASATYFTCKNAVVGESGTKAYFGYSLGETAGTTAADLTGNARPGTYAATGITYSAAGPCPRDTPASRAITLDGASGYVSGPNSTQANLQVFSEQIWFRTSVAGGKLIGFGNQRTGASGQYDRHLYIDNDGKLYFGIYNGGAIKIATPTTVTDNKWHQAVATLSSAGMVLYLDGKPVATNANTAAENTTGYWRIGYDNLNGWATAGVNYYFTGSLAWASVYTYALTATQSPPITKPGSADPGRVEMSQTGDSETKPQVQFVSGPSSRRPPARNEAPR